MPRIFIDLGYIGKRFSGFQKQSNAISIQGELDKALSVLLHQNIITVTSSRTDAGVHAKHNFLHADIPTSFDTKKMVYQLNAILPSDIVVHEIYFVKSEAHSRFDATARLYSYQVHQKKDPFVSECSYFYPFSLDLHLLESCAEIFLTNSDFKTFAKKHSEVNNFNCQISHCKWQKTSEHQLLFTVKSNRFLRGMVRALVGTSLQVARGKMNLDELRSIIIKQDNAAANFSAEAQGLCLEKVFYPDALKLT